MPLRRLVLETSLKPFFCTDDTNVDAVSEEIFRQWYSLIRHADEIAILIWASDGSEILDYRGNINQPMEWAKYIGGANPKNNIAGDPQGNALHSRYYLYRDNPPALTYADLAGVVASLKRIGNKITGMNIQVGATFDPGPEFAKSDFKYNRHHEICLAGTMGEGQHRFVTCYTNLHSDNISYAGFPNGIPEGTPLGTFMGRQCNAFIRDMGFDYIWFSNGFGFGTETWNATGTLFDGKKFEPARRNELAEKVIGFWRHFRNECNTPIETRGTNLSVGVDIATDAVPIKAIYQGGFDFKCPPNSPWAALDGDFGLELSGYLSRIAELPSGQTGYPFRYYTHDPWWMNSPWLDRYGREAHDIYLPMSVSRLDETGKAQTPSDIEFLTIDNSLGQMPDQVPNEVIPHVLKALDDQPDAAGPVIWLYPFDEFNNIAFGESARLEEIFFHDMLIRGAINHGLPVNTVATTSNALSIISKNPNALAGRILLCRVPDAGTALSAVLLDWISNGGKVLLFGSTEHADNKFRKALNLELHGPVSGQCELLLSKHMDELENDSAFPQNMVHRALTSGGGCMERLADKDDSATRVLAEIKMNDDRRIIALSRKIGRGMAAWVRGTVSASFDEGGIGTYDKPADVFPAERLLRWAMAELGLKISTAQNNAAQRAGITCIARRSNGWFFSGYTPDTTVEMRYELPNGAPIFIGCEADLANGQAAYRMPRAWHRECRILIKQTTGIVSCREQHSGDINTRRRIYIEGLSNATLTFYPEPGSADNVQMLRKPLYPFYEGDLLQPVHSNGPDGETLSVEGVTGNLLISW